MDKFNVGGLIARFAASLGLVLATYNPTGHSYVQWVSANFPHLQPLQAVVGIGLAGLWLFFVHSTWRSLGTAFAAALIWLFTSWGWFSLSNQSALTWAILLVLSALLTLGLSWALIKAKLSGQSTVQEVKG